MVLGNERPPKYIKTSKELPDEIIVDVLLRLRVKSLLHCKSLCKLWYSFISDPYFVKSHLTLSTSNKDYARHRLMLLTTEKNPYAESCSLYDVLYDHKSITNTLEELDYPLKEYGRSSLIIGCCNGLFCIYFGKDNICIWNPSTRKYKRLPNCESRPWGLFNGFGYDEYSDDYKLVGRYTDTSKDESESTVNIYSLKTGKWKVIRDFPGCHGNLGSECTFLNGAFHWIVECYESFTFVIVSLDLATETYSKLVLPPMFDFDLDDDDEDEDDDDDDDTIFGLGVLGEWLRLGCINTENRTDVWVMKDSWTKLFAIPCPTDCYSYHVSMPLCISNDGKILLQMNKELGLYDPSNTSFSKIQNFDKDLSAYTFGENLVSLDGIADNSDDVN